MNLNQLYLKNKRIREVLLTILSISVPLMSWGKGEGPFSVETKVSYSNSAKTKGKVEFEVSYNEKDSFLKIANFRSDNSCFKLSRKSSLIKGISSKKQILQKGSLRFDLISNVPTCDLIFDVQAKDDSGLQSITKVIHLKMP